MACLDAHIFTSSAEVDWGGNYTNFHSNLPQHMWIDVNTWTSKQDLNWCEYECIQTSQDEDFTPTIKISLNPL